LKWDFLKAKIPVKTSVNTLFRLKTACFDEYIAEMFGVFQLFKKFRKKYPKVVSLAFRQFTFLKWLII